MNCFVPLLFRALPKKQTIRKEISETIWASLDHSNGFVTVLALYVVACRTFDEVPPFICKQELQGKKFDLKSNEHQILHSR